MTESDMSSLNFEVTLFFHQDDNTRVVQIAFETDSISDHLKGLLEFIRFEVVTASGNDDGTAIHGVWHSEFYKPDEIDDLKDEYEVIRKAITKYNGSVPSFDDLEPY